MKKRRLDLGLLQREVAQKIGVKKETIYNWENNRAEPCFRYFPQVVGFLGYVPCPYTPTSLGEKLLSYRRSLGLSHEKIAKIMGVDPSTVLDWEKGRHTPTPKSMEIIERFFCRQSQF